MSKPKFNYGDEVVLYPFIHNPEIYYITHCFSESGEEYGLKLVNGDDTIQRITFANSLQLLTPEMKTKILLGIPLDE